ncbi:Acetyltransferase, (GNAT) family, partial [Pseudoloma neurophilia]
MIAIKLVDTDWRDAENQKRNTAIKRAFKKKSTEFVLPYKKNIPIRSKYFNHSSTVIGYVMGKIEQQTIRSFFQNKKEPSMHISAISVTSSYRHNRFATYLCEILEKQSTNFLFIDLFVRSTNFKAINFYEKMGYVIYRRIFMYYSLPEEDAFDMRKFLTMKPCKGKDVSAME